MTSQVHNRAPGGRGMQQMFHKDWGGLSSLPPSLCPTSSPKVSAAAQTCSSLPHPAGTGR